MYNCYNINAIRRQLGESQLVDCYNINAIRRQLGESQVADKLVFIIRRQILY